MSNKEPPDSINSYISHWNTPPKEPVSIRWVESLVSSLGRYGKWWRPHDESRIVVDHKLLNSSQSRNLDKMIPDYKEHIEVGTDQLIEANEKEIANRIYHSIYWGNLYDDLLPIESRYYAPVIDTLPKLFVMLIVPVFFLFITTILPSVLYGNYSVESRLQENIGNVSYNQINEKFNKVFKGQLNSNKILLNTNNMLEHLVLLKNKTSRLVESSNYIYSSWFKDTYWDSLSEPQREEVIIEAVFVKRVSLNPEIFDQLHSRYRFLVVPSNNKLEIFSQVVIIFLIVFLLRIFLAKKSEFLSMIKKMPFMKRPDATNLLEEVISSHFFYRKKYHYLISLVIASCIIFFHYYAIDVNRSEFINSIDAILPLKGYDYRLDGNPKPVFFLYWLIQFYIVYILVLVAWELGALSSCMRLWQFKLIQKRIIKKPDFRSHFDDLRNHQNSTLAVLLLCTFSLLSFFSYKKAEGSQFDLFTLQGTDLSQMWRFIVANLNVDNLYYLYFFSPPFLTAILVMYALRACYKDSKKAEIYGKNNLPDLDEVIKEGSPIVKFLHRSIIFIFRLENNKNKNKNEKDNG